MRKPRTNTLTPSRCHMQQGLAGLSGKRFHSVGHTLRGHFVHTQGSRQSGHLGALLEPVLPCGSFNPLPFSIQVNRVMTYRDLDNDLMKYSAFQTLVSGPASTQRGPASGTSVEKGLSFSRTEHTSSTSPRLPRNAKGDIPGHLTTHSDPP